MQRAAGGLLRVTVEEWREARPFLESFVAGEDRALYSWNYHNRVARLAFPVTFRFRGLRKDGTTFAAETDMIPISHRGTPSPITSCAGSRSRERSGSRNGMTLSIREART